MSAGWVRRMVEVPTLILAAMIYGGWLALTWFHAVLPPWAVVVGGGWLLAWHGSLQHETIHGHPTPWPRVNAAIGAVPLSLWLPYRVYRESHLTHHRSPALTDPLEDPESRYLSSRDIGIVCALCALEATLLGRLLIGPLVATGRFLAEEVVRAVREPGGAARDWVPHLMGVAAILLWLRICGFAIGHYLLLCVYPGTALTLLRSFAEHRADPVPGRRVAIVEGTGLLGLLYLNNNLHAAHHRIPGLPWYALPAYHARHHAVLLLENGGLAYRGYREVAARFLLRSHDRLVHPDHRP